MEKIILPAMEKKTQQKILDILADDYHGTGPALRFNSVWQLLVAVVLSAQTNDNQVNRITGPLFENYPDAASLAKLSPEQLEPLISTCGLYKNKAKNLVAAACMVCEEYHGQVPADKELLMRLPGVGGKSANVILAVGFGIPALAVDTHVFRVSNRLGLVEAKTPEQAEQQLCTLIPREKWADAHHWLIWHGRRVCTSRNPKCSLCSLAALCPSCER